MENKKNSCIKKLFLTIVIEIVAFTAIMLFVLGIIKLLNEFLTINDIIYNTVMYISSTIIGIGSLLFVIKLLFKDSFEADKKKIIIGMIFIQILVFILLFISAQDIINRTIISLKQEANIKAAYYDENTIEFLLFSSSYDEWKAKYIKEIDASKNVFQKYSLITISLHGLGALLGIAISSIKSKYRNRNHFTSDTF